MSTQQQKPDWLVKALERQIIDQAELTHILIEAANSEVPCEQLIEQAFAHDPATLNRLRELIQALKPISLENLDATVGLRSQNRKPSSVDRTVAVGRKRSVRGESHSEKLSAQLPPVSTDSKSSAPQQPRSNSSANVVEMSREMRLELDELRRGPDRFEILEEIGRGGCGIVATALDRQLDRQVVVKTLGDKSVSEEMMRRFLNEAKITGQLEHPGIVPVYEVGIDEDKLPYYAMRHVRGMTLSDKIEKLRCATGAEKHRLLHELLNRFVDVCQTLAYAHQANIIHRDIKPANIMVGEFGETVVLDWGLARRVDQQPEPNEETLGAGKRSLMRSKIRRAKRGRSSTNSNSGSSSNMTRIGSIMGTAAYMAPEQALGLNDRVDSRSDVFSLGVVLYEILSGASPFQSNSIDDTIERVARCEYLPLKELQKGIPKPLAAICTHAMQRDQDSRYANARKLAEDMQSYLAGSAVSVHHEKIWERFDRFVSRHHGIFRALFGGALVITFTACLAYTSISQAHLQEKNAKELAQDAHSETRKALQSERLARRLAEKQLIKSREATDTWLIDLSGDLQYYPGLSDLRSQLLDQGESQYEQLLHDAQTEKSPKVDQASILIRLGDLARLRGSASEAKERFTAAKDLLFDLQNTDEGVALARINAHLGLALVAIESEGVELQQTGHTYLQKARKYLTEISEQENGPEFENALVRMQLIESRLVAMDNPQKAADLLSDTEERAQRLYQVDPSPRFTKLVCNVLEDRARYLASTTANENSIGACDRLIAFYESLLEKSPNRPDWLESLSLAHTQLGALYLQINEVTSATAQYNLAAENLAAATDVLYGDAIYRENRATLATNRGIALRKSEDWEPAIESFQAAIHDLRWLVEFDGITNERVLRMLHTYQALAETLLACDGPDVGDYLENCNVLLDHLSSIDIEDSNLRALYFNHELLRAGVANLAHDDGAIADCSRRIRAIATSEISDLERNFMLAHANRIEATMTVHRGAEEGARLAALSFGLFRSVAQAEATSARAQLLAQEAVLNAVQLACDSSSSTQFAEAERLCEQWTMDSPASALAWHWLAWSRLRCDKNASANKALLCAEELDADALHNKLVREAVNFRTGKVDESQLTESIAKLIGDQKYLSRHARAIIEFINAEFVNAN